MAKHGPNKLTTMTFDTLLFKKKKKNHFWLIYNVGKIFIIFSSQFSPLSIITQPCWYILINHFQKVHLFFYTFISHSVQVLWKPINEAGFTQFSYIQVTTTLKFSIPILKFNKVIWINIILYIIKALFIFKWSDTNIHITFISTLVSRKENNLSHKTHLIKNKYLLIPTSNCLF